MKSYYQDYDGRHCDFNGSRYDKDTSDTIESNIREARYRKIDEELRMEERDVDTAWVEACFACCCYLCSEERSRTKAAEKQHLKFKSEQAPPDGSIKLVAGIEDPALWAHKFDLRSSQSIMDKIEEQEDRLYVAPSRILPRLHYLYNLEQDTFFQENAEFWQEVYQEYTKPQRCASDSKASVMAKFLHSTEKLADFYNRKVGDTKDQSVYAYTPKRQQQIKEWYKHVEEEGAIPCDMRFDLCLVDSCKVPCCGGPANESSYNCCEPPYATHPQADWCCVTHILGALWCSDHPNAGFCFFQC